MHTTKKGHSFTKPSWRSCCVLMVTSGGTLARVKTGQIRCPREVACKNKRKNARILCRRKSKKRKSIAIKQKRNGQQQNSALTWCDCVALPVLDQSGGMPCELYVALQSSSGTSLTCTQTFSNISICSHPAAWFTKYLAEIPKLRSSYDGRLIYKTSYTGHKAFLRHNSLAKW